MMVRLLSREKECAEKYRKNVTSLYGFGIQMVKTCDNRCVIEICWMNAVIGG